MCYRIVISDQLETDALTTLCMPKLHRLWEMHQTMYEVIENCAEKHQGTIYGGYVRDLIALEVPRNIDIRFTSFPSVLCGKTLGHLINTFVEALVKFGFDVYPIGEISEYYPYCVYPIGEISEYYPYCVIVQKNDLSIILKLCGQFIADCTFKKTDFDVNQLTLSLMKSTSHDTRVLIKRILAKTMRVLNHTPSNHIWRQSEKGEILWKRMQSMKQRGWTIDNEYCCDNEECILSNIQSKGQ
jgi:hypothetical protein